MWKLKAGLKPIVYERQLEVFSIQPPQIADKAEPFDEIEVMSYLEENRNENQYFIDSPWDRDGSQNLYRGQYEKSDHGVIRQGLG